MEVRKEIGTKKHPRRNIVGGRLLWVVHDPGMSDDILAERFTYDLCDRRIRCQSSTLVCRDGKVVQ